MVTSPSGLLDSCVVTSKECLTRDSASEHGSHTESIFDAGILTVLAFPSARKEGESH